MRSRTTSAPWSSEAELREGEDCYVDELYAGAAELGVPLLAALWPRTYLIRTGTPGDVDLDLIEGSWPGEVPAERQGEGRQGAHLAHAGGRPADLCDAS